MDNQTDTRQEEVEVTEFDQLFASWEANEGQGEG